MSASSMFALAGLLVCVSGAAVPPPPTEEPVETAERTDKCAALLKPKGMSFSSVGHAIHSLTVSDLRRLFDPQATALNFVPTLNFDLSADQPILPHALDLKGDDDALFRSSEMKMVDFVLSHMGQKQWDIKHYSPLERVVHIFHMNEVWVRAKSHFDRLDKAPVSQQLCDCAMDVEHNGVLKYLRISGLAIREPALMYQNVLDRPDSAVDPLSYYIQYTYRFKLSEDESSPTTLGEKDVLRQLKEAQPELSNLESWNNWKKIMTGMPEQEDYNTALFLHCAVRKARAHRHAIAA